MMKKKLWNILCIVVLAAIVIITLWGVIHKKNQAKDDFSDGLEKLEADVIYLEGSRMEVSFSDVILSNQNETRKLIVSEQEGTVSTLLTSRLIQQIDFDFMKKTQTISYTGKGYFVVDLSHLTKDDVIEDKEHQTIRILIDHAYLETVDINPDDIIIDEVKESLLARGKMKLTVAEYNEIERQLRQKLELQFNTPENAQEADDIALKMVKELYETVIKAIDPTYQVEVGFKGK
ncbi:MAG: DUF4230 domain-containing protein [bacterium]|nr:DUF4230 domain-containing protein [bacterium]MDY4100831.1 DUF4230 domain-containing protein [Lachnospiraceae bacterium]